MNFNERLVSARKAKGFSQESLGENLGLSRQAISKWETGESKPDLDNLIALCEQLDISIEYLCFGQRGSSQQPAQNPPVSRIRIFLIAGIAVVSLMIGLLIGYLIPHEAPINDTAQECYGMVESLSVIDATLGYEYDSDSILLSITTNQMLENVDMFLLVENKDFPDLNRTTVCTANEFGYTANLYLLPNYNYRITAVIQYDNEKRLIPIMDLSMDDDISYEYSFLFEE